MTGSCYSGRATRGRPSALAWAWRRVVITAGRLWLPAVADAGAALPTDTTERPSDHADGARATRSARWTRVGALVALVGGTVATAPRPSPAPPRAHAAATVMSFVQSLVGPSVLGIEHAVTLADRHVLVYRLNQETNATLGVVLAQQSRLLADASVTLSSLTAPALGSALTRLLERLLEDLAVCSHQLADVLRDTATALALPTSTSLQLSVEAVNVVYGPRVRAAVALLRRAEDWLDTLDHATGAQATLPGFEPGAPSLENVLALQ